MPPASPVALLLVIDAVGLSTLEHLLRRSVRRPELPNLSRLGLGEIVSGEFRDRFRPGYSGGSYAAALEQASATADSLVGHREMMGVLDDRTYDLFNDGFPREYIAALEARIGRGTFFNKMAAGMEAIELNAGEHERTGKPIVNVPDSAMRQTVVSFGGPYSPLILPSPRAAALVLDRMAWYASHRDRKLNDERAAAGLPADPDPKDD